MPPPTHLPPGPRLIQAYYLATPLFFLVDVFLSFPIRVSALADPGLRYLYYAFALGCGVATRVRPKVGPYVGLAESSLNILLLVLSTSTRPASSRAGIPIDSADLLLKI